MIKKGAILILFLLTGFSCQDYDFNISNLNNNEISVLGHGGMGIGHVYPMNTYESIMNCLNLGADGTEIDVQITKDSVLVAYHDKLLQHSTDKSGKIYQHNWKEIKDANYKNPPYVNYKIRSLNEIFSNIPDLHNYLYFIDYKNYNPDTSSIFDNIFIKSLEEIIVKHQLQNNIYVGLKDIKLIASLREQKPNLNIFIYAGFENANIIAKKYNLQGITIDVDEISADQVKKAHANEIMIAVYNAHSKESNIEAVEKNVDFIQSGKIKHLLKILN